MTDVLTANPGYDEHEINADDKLHIHNELIYDFYQNSDGRRGHIESLLADREMEGFYGDPSIDLTRKRLSNIDLLNPSTHWMHTNLPGFADWHSLIPTAAALEPIYSPEIQTLGNGKAFTPEMRSWIFNIADARGIRSRAQIMKQVMIDKFRTSPHALRTVSLGCGAAQPIVSTLVEINHMAVPTPEILLVDIDPQALKLAQRKIEEAKLKADGIELRRMNVLDPNGLAGAETNKQGFYNNVLARARKSLPANAFDVVDAVGLLEYLKPDDWDYKYSYGKVIHTTRKMAGAQTFLKNAYELVAPGGILIAGNMRDTHPQLGFTLNVIQWPHIQPRSIEQMATIIREAGIDADVDVYCPDDGVYAIYVIRKPM